MLRLRVIDGLTLQQIDRRFGVSRERVRQLLNYDFRLKGTPPAGQGTQEDPGPRRPTRDREHRAASSSRELSARVEGHRGLGPARGSRLGER